MRRSTRTELAELAAYPEEFARLLDAIAAGKSPLEVCRDRLWSYREWRAWIAEDDGRAAAFNFALDCWDEAKQYERLEIADGAQVDDVAVAKLRSDTRGSVTSMRPNSRWAAKAGGAGGGGITVIVQRGGTEPPPPAGRAPVVIDNETIVV
jgi:hypothetical protein